MLRTLLCRQNFLAGIAIFSMFFGAGNVVFPLLLGLKAKGQFPLALLGLIITSIGFPLLGVIGSSLFKGRALPFFLRAGKPIGLTMMIISLGLLGPIAVMPRCVTVAYAATVQMIPGLSLPVFCLIFGALAFAITLKKNSIMKIVGLVLSPLLLISLFMIIFKGLSGELHFASSNLSNMGAFHEGMLTGYDTLDLIASLFFSATIWQMLSLNGSKKVFNSSVFSSLIGGVLLALVYAGLCIVTAANSGSLAHISPDKLLTQLALIQLGPIYGAIANLAIAIACLTTIISICITITTLVKEETKIKISEKWINFSWLTVMTFFGMWGFEQLMGMIHYMAQLLYPAIIVLTVANIGHKKWGFKWIKTPVTITLLLTILHTSILNYSRLKARDSCFIAPLLGQLHKLYNRSPYGL
ncbi:MAG: branched-chain amino acid transport system II carrier protein [Rhabdochlamydiaceae bacterium]|nr:branched-chain amino acid transport system II carrier protein [Candidatus Amphrikana amoebophyrae]